MVRTKHALYVARHNPSHEGSSPSHEGDYAKEGHRRLIVSACDRRHLPKSQSHRERHMHLIGPLDLHLDEVQLIFH